METQIKRDNNQYTAYTGRVRHSDVGCWFFVRSAMNKKTKQYFVRLRGAHCLSPFGPYFSLFSTVRRFSRRQLKKKKNQHLILLRQTTMGAATMARVGRLAFGT